MRVPILFRTHYGFGVLLVKAVDETGNGPNRKSGVDGSHPSVI